MKRARDLIEGDIFFHNSRIKLPNPLTVKEVIVNKKVTQVKSTLLPDYTFTFNNEQKVKTYEQ